MVSPAEREMYDALNRTLPMLRNLAEKSEKWSLFIDEESFSEARTIQVVFLDDMALSLTITITITITMTLNMMPIQVFLDDMTRCMHAVDQAQDPDEGSSLTLTLTIMPILILIHPHPHPHPYP